MIQNLRDGHRATPLIDGLQLRTNLLDDVSAVAPNDAHSPERSDVPRSEHVANPLDTLTELGGDVAGGDQVVGSGGQHAVRLGRKRLASTRASVLGACCWLRPLWRSDSGGLCVLLLLRVLALLPGEQVAEPGPPPSLLATQWRQGGHFPLDPATDRHLALNDL